MSCFFFRAALLWFSFGRNAGHLGLLGSDETSFEYRVGNDARHQFTCTNRIVVAWNDVVDQIRVTVGVDHCDERKSELVRFGNCGVLELGVENEDRVRSLGEHLNTTEVALELGELSRNHQRFLLWHRVELARVAHALVFLHLVDALLNGLEVRQHATEPTLVDVGHAALLGVGLDGVLGLTLGSDEEDVATVCREVTDVGVGVFETVERLVEVNDVDAVALAVDESLHLRVPTTGLVSEVDARVKQLLHRDNCHGYTFLRFRWTDAPALIATAVERQGSLTDRVATIVGQTLPIGHFIGSLSRIRVHRTKRTRVSKR